MAPHAILILEVNTARTMERLYGGFPAALLQIEKSRLEFVLDVRKPRLLISQHRAVEKPKSPSPFFFMPKLVFGSKGDLGGSATRKL